MKRILATASAIFIMTLFVPGSYVVAQDHGAPDTLYLIPSELDANGNDSIFKLEAWIFNDIDGVEIKYGFEWDSELITLDSAKQSPLATSNDMMPIFYEKADIDISNENNRAMYVSFDFMFSPMPPGPDQKLLATYYFSVSDWTRQSEIKIDTLSWDGDSEMIFITENGEVYPPVWYGGDQPLIVRDVNSNCCGLYTDGFTGNTNCDPDGRRELIDVLWLVARVYLDKIELCCEANGNVDGDVEGKIDLQDIFALIDHLYLSKTETTPCQ